MPIYEYQCPDCGHRFELIQKFSDPPATSCPQCAKDNVRKLVSAASFVLKGSGWYRDHYGLKSGGASEGAASGGSSASGDSAGGSTTGASSGTSGGASAPSAPSAPSGGTPSGSTSSSSSSAAGSS